MVDLVYDSRETKIKELLEKDPKESITLKSEYLDLGDFLFKKDGELVLIIERKSMNDLYSSIHDGRYKEQKMRLLNNYPLNKIVYIIEGVLNSKTKIFKNSKVITEGALLNMVFRDKITVLRTTDIKETSDTIYRLGNKIIKHPEFFVSEKVETKSNYLDSVKICKKDNMTPTLCNIVQLCQIPGVSKNIASSVLDKYGSISMLILEYEKIDDIKIKITMLKDLPNNTRKIGPVISKRIYEYFFY
jgi:ERCC4-type nuclease